MPTTGSNIPIACISPRVYAVKYGPRLVLHIKDAKVVLRRGGRRLGHWLKYLVGKVFGTGERVMICLGNAVRHEVEEWFVTANGSDMAYALRMIEAMLKKLGYAKCLAIALLALREE